MRYLSSRPHRRLSAHRLGVNTMLARLSFGGRLGRTAALALTLVAALAACSSGSGGPGVVTLAKGSPDPSASASPSGSQDPAAAILAYAQCMRDHGVDMPDPQVDSTTGGMTVQIGSANGGDAGTGPTKAQMEAAQTACSHLLPTLSGKNPGEISAEDQDKALAYAKCMRDHGVDMPDPKFDGGGISMEIKGNMDPGSATFQDAQSACAGEMPFKGGGPGTIDSTGGDGTIVGPIGPGASSAPVTVP
jgi:hypothetical protein